MHDDLLVNTRSFSSRMDVETWLCAVEASDIDRQSLSSLMRSYAQCFKDNSSYLALPTTAAVVSFAVVASW